VATIRRSLKNASAIRLAGTAYAAVLAFAGIGFSVRASIVLRPS
jgi:hypothetical protein